MVTTLNGDWDTSAFLIRSDSLLIKKEQWQTDVYGDHYRVEWRPFKLLSQNTDTIRMLIAPGRLSKPTAREDTLIFVCLETLKEPIHNFTYFNVTEVSPWHGTIDISIDSIGRLVYFRKIRNPSDTAEKTDNRVTTRVLTKQEFDKFKDRLSYSLLLKLRRFRGGCDAMDASRTSLEIIYNNKRVISKGCTLQWPQSMLYEDVYDLANKKANRAESKPTTVKLGAPKEECNERGQFVRKTELLRQDKYEQQLLKYLDWVSRVANLHYSARNDLTGLAIAARMA